MKFKNIRRDDGCVTAESELAGEFLERTIDHRDDLPEDMRVIVIVATGVGNGTIGCAFEGYDSDERLALDLQLLSQAVDLGAGAES